MSTVGVRNFDIHKMLLYSNNFQTNPVDISRLFFNITVSENLFLPYLSGHISITDKDGWLEALPILGEEHLLLDIEPSSLVNDITGNVQSPNATVKGYFRVYKISPLAREHERGSIYSLSFVSTEYFQSQKTKVFKTYKNKKISTIVQELYDRYIKRNIKSEYQKEIDIEPTLMLKNYVAPNITAIRALLNLSKEAISENISNAQGAIYVFFETIDKFHFKSLETLMSQESKRKFLYQPKNVSVDDDIGKDLSTLRYEIDAFKVSQTFDVLKNMQKGMYASTLITYDFERMSYEEHNYSYINPAFANKEQQHLSTGDILTVESEKVNSSITPQIDRGKRITEGFLCTQDMDLLASYDSNIMLQSTDQYQDLYFEKNHTRAGGYKEPGLKPKDVEQWGVQRQSQLQQLQNIQVEVLLSTGDAILHVGDTIELDIPSEVGRSVESSHKYYSGKYLISEVIQTISPTDGFETTLKLLKNSLETVPDKFNKEILEETKSFRLTRSSEKAKELMELNKKIRGFGSIRTPTAMIAIKG